MTVSAVGDFHSPLATFALIAYNQEHYVSEAIAGAFAQTYSPLEIILSDDCSNDGTFEIMKRAAAEYAGPHRVVLNRNLSNLNIGGHFNAVGAIAAGELIVLAAGDDVSFPSRTEQLVGRWDAVGRRPAVLYSDFVPVDAFSEPVILNGEAIDRGPFLIRNMARGDVRGLGATVAVSKNLFSCFPPLHADVRHEDRVFPFRALLLGGIVELVDEKLIRYRVEGGISREQVKSGRDFLHRHVAALSQRTLPDAVQRLLDLKVALPGNLPLRKACIATIADHQALIELTKVRGFGVDACLIKWWQKGARPPLLIKMYMKIRFIAIFEIYYRWRFGKRRDI